MAIRVQAVERPRRGTAAATRERLVDAAAEVFNRDGYAGTDSNRLARAAGYAPGTFYKHFADKRAIFLAVYEDWVNDEWRAVGEEMSRGGEIAAIASRLVERTVALHRRWRGFRASLRALVAQDSEARAFYRRQRRRQIELLAHLNAPRSSGPGPAADAVLLYTLERVCDAIADGELRDLGVSVEQAVALLCAQVEARIRAGRAPARRRRPRVTSGASRT